MLERSRSAIDPGVNLANDPPWLTVLYWFCFILAPEAAVSGNVFAYWAATHAYRIRESSEAGPSIASEDED